MHVTMKMKKEILNAKSVRSQLQKRMMRLLLNECIRNSIVIEERMMKSGMDIISQCIQIKFSRASKKTHLKIEQRAAF